MFEPISAFKLRPTVERPKLTGPENWFVWSRFRKMHLNYLNVYFTLHEMFTDPFSLSSEELDAYYKDRVEGIFGPLE